MSDTFEMPKPEEPKNNRTRIIIAVVAALLICFCCVLAIALYYGYDYLDDPLGIYGALPRSMAMLVG